MIKTEDGATYKRERLFFKIQA